MSGGTVPLQVGGTPGECTVEIDVTSTVPGNLINTIPANAVNATGDGNINITNTTPASATLTVISVEAPPIYKVFEPDTIWVGQTSQLRIEIVNNNTTSSFTSVMLTDTLPANVILANPPLPGNALSFCGGGASLTAVAGGSSVTLVTGRFRDGEMVILGVLPGHEKAEVVEFLRSIPQRILQRVQAVCCDLWEAYIEVVREEIPAARIVADRFHVARHYRKAADQLRKQELQRLKKELTKEESKNSREVCTLVARMVGI